MLTFAVGAGLAAFVIVGTVGAQPTPVPTDGSQPTVQTPDVQSPSVPSTPSTANATPNAVTPVRPIPQPQLEAETIDPINAKLEKQTIIKMSCADGSTKTWKKEQSPVQLSEACKIEAKWLHVNTTVNDPINGDFTINPKRLLVVASNGKSATVAFELPIGTYLAPSTDVEAGDWADKLEFGKSYDILVEYEISQPTRSGATPQPRRALGFRLQLVKSRWAAQFTGKVYTAWKISGNGDASFIVPGLSAGVAYRVADNYNDSDVVALRAVVAVGPNLVPSSDPSTPTKNKLQFLLGGEVVVARYVSFGAAWVVAGPDRSTTPLFLLTYGDLYPAISTK